MNIKIISKKIISLVLVVAFSVLVFAPDNSSMNFENVRATSKTDELEEQIKKNKEQQQRLDAEIKAAENDKAKEAEHQSAIKSQIEVTQNSIDKLEKLSAENEANILKKQEEIDEKTQEIEEQIKMFEKRIRAMYLSGDGSAISVILGAESFYDALMKLELVKRVSKHDNDLVEELLTNKRSLETSKEELEKEKADLEKSKQEYESNKSKLASLYTQSQEMVDEIKAQEQMYRDKAAELEEENEKVEQEIQRIIREEQKRIEAERQRKAEEERKRREEEAKQNGTTVEDETEKPQVSETGYAWPVPGFTMISSGFGARWGTTHKGIDIAGYGIEGAPIVASKSGEVIIANTNDIPGYSYGKYVVIIHDDGTSTLYGHAKSLAVSVGQEVKQGETIAYVGTTGFSTGFHLHFEIRIDGVQVDPLPYLR